MARATFVKKARKNYREHGIKKGESYWWWKFRFGGKHYSKMQPRRSQLTQSAYLASLYDIEDQISSLTGEEGLADECAAIAESLRELASECEEKRGNMPDQLQDSESGALLEERADACNAAADELEGLDFDDKEEGEKTEDYWQRKLEEIHGVSING